MGQKGQENETDCANHHAFIYMCRWVAAPCRVELVSFANSPNGPALGPVTGLCLSATLDWVPLTLNCQDGEPSTTALTCSTASPN